MTCSKGAVSFNLIKKTSRQTRSRYQSKGKEDIKKSKQKW
jgi:hypothetical protein